MGGSDPYAGDARQVILRIMTVAAAVNQRGDQVSNTTRSRMRRR